MTPPELVIVAEESVREVDFEGLRKKVGRQLSPLAQTILHCGQCSWKVLYSACQALTSRTAHEHVRGKSRLDFATRENGILVFARSLANTSRGMIKELAID